MIYMNEKKSKEILEWAKKNRDDYCKKFFRSEEKEDKNNQKIAIFMAGSPWAGKTEFINKMIHEDIQSSCYVLDLDKIRKDIPWYNGRNAEEYQSGANKILEKMVDTCNDKRYSFILDWTFSNSATMERNITRLIKKEYTILIFHIHFPPEIAWKFTISREINEGRKVPLKVFLYDYRNSFENVKNIKKVFGKNVSVFFLKKELSHNTHIISETLSFLEDSESIDENRLANFIQPEYNVRRFKLYFVYWYFKLKSLFLWKKKLLKE